MWCSHFNLFHPFRWNKLLQSVSGALRKRLHSSGKYIWKQNLWSASDRKRYFWLLWSKFLIYVLLWVPVRPQQSCLPPDKYWTKINWWTGDLFFVDLKRRENDFLPYTDCISSFLHLLLYFWAEKDQGKLWVDQRVFSDSAQKCDGKHENRDISQIANRPSIIGQLLINISG